MRFRQLLLAGVAAFALAPATMAQQAPEQAQAPAQTPVAAPAADAPVATNRPVANPVGRTVSFGVPIRERGPLGEVNVEIDVAGNVRINAADLARALNPLIRPERGEALVQLADADGFMRLETASAQGFTLTWDEALQEVVVAIPLEARRSRSIPLGWASLEDPPIDTTDRSSPFAAHLNYRAFFDYVHESQGALDTGWQSPRVDLDFNGRIRPIAFENRLTVDGDAEQTVARTSSRLIYDHLPSLVRYSAGDILINPISFQGVPQLLGIAAERQRTLLPGRVATARAGQTLIIREPSTVDIVINGATVRTLRLDPGQYDVRDLPLGQGANAVEFVVRGDSGVRESLRFDFFSDAQLLAPGLDEFFVGAGILAETSVGEPDYFQDTPLVSAFYRRGITDQFTTGGFIQATDAVGQLGAEALYGNRLGLFYLTAAASRADGFDTGWALRGEWRLNREVRTERIQGVETFGFSVETRSEDFAVVDRFFTPSNPDSVILRANYGRPLSRDLTGSVSVDQSFGRGNNPDRTGVFANLAWRLDVRTNLLFTAGWQSPAPFDEEEFFVGVNITRQFTDLISGFASAESRDERLQVGLSRNPLRPIDDWGATANFTRTEDSVSGAGAATWFSNRGDAEISHVTATDAGGSNIVFQQSSLLLAGSIATTGNRIGLGRQLPDSFALVDGHPSLEGRQVLIRPATAEFELARSGAFGPAVVPLNAYSPQEIPYDVLDAPLGYDLGAGNFPVFPHLYSGFAFTVGSAFNVTATGTMLDSAGDPVRLAVGEARLVGVADSPVVEVVTNRVGRFGASGLSQGTWRVTFPLRPELAYEIIVPAETSLLRTGEIRPVD
jgi:outer membrane usher protein